MKKMLYKVRKVEYNSFHDELKQKVVKVLNKKSMPEW